MSGQVLAGEFQRDATGLVIAPDVGLAGSTTYTPGATRTDPLHLQPTLVETWSIVGFTVRVRLALMASTNVGQVWGRLGTLWAGLITDSSLPSQQLAGFPTDLSTMTAIWDGKQDEVRTVPLAVPVNPLDCSLIAATFMLPQPISVRSGSQLQMGLVLTPSMLTCAAGTLGLLVLSCSYSVIYND